MYKYGLAELEHARIHTHTTHIPASRTHFMCAERSISCCVSVCACCLCVRIHTRGAQAAVGTSDIIYYIKRASNGEANARTRGDRRQTTTTTPATRVRCARTGVECFLVAATAARVEWKRQIDVLPARAFVQARANEHSVLLIPSQTCFRNSHGAKRATASKSKKYASG